MPGAPIDLHAELPYTVRDMGGVPVKHHSKGKVGRRRSHLAMKKTNMAACAKCKGPVMPHRACAQCGAYKKKARAAKTKTG